MTSSRHRWQDKVVISAFKSERVCARCGVVMASFKQWEAGRDLYWKEYWRDESRVDAGDGSHVPPCDARLEAAA